MERLSLAGECRLEKMEEELPSQRGEGGNFQRTVKRREKGEGGSHNPDVLSEE